MCLITVALRASARFPVVVAANRDERHARPSAPAGWWADAPGVLGGRDLVAGGTWLAVDRHGRLGAVSNRAPFEPQPEPAPRSRGALVVDYLSRDLTADAFAAQARARGHEYGPFNLVLVDASGVRAVSNTGEDVRLSAGIRSFGNAGLDEAWPKLDAAAAGVEAALDATDPVAALFGLLATRRAPSPPRGPDRENLFIVGPDFGTRCSSVILVETRGRAVFAERRFDARGKPLGETRIEFDVVGGASEPGVAPRGR